MLNISENSIKDELKDKEYNTFSILGKRPFKGRFLKVLAGLGVLFLFTLFLPWTQTIRAKGYVTTRLPSERPQMIQSVISGKIEKWWVREGDYVEQGDTILYLSEVKAEYFDQDLVERTQEQLSAKESSLIAYNSKIEALSTQYETLDKNRINKIAQTENKIIQAKNDITIDSSKLVALRNKLDIAENQVKRVEQLYDTGLKSLSELQEKQAKFQEVQAEFIAQENKLANKRNALLNYQLDVQAVDQEYQEKMAKSNSDKQSAISAKQNTLADIAKMKNQLQNYQIRRGFYYITAPQNGYITKTLKKGIGEIIKEGSEVASISPDLNNLAVEVYVLPLDLPLLYIGEESRLKFDGWPAIFISGWPKEFAGIFTGEIVAIDRFISDNGYYRILIGPKEGKKQWPNDLRVGAGVQSFSLLNDVPIWYEIWRQLNGFPADFYHPDNKVERLKETKAPIKKVK